MKDNDWLITWLGFVCVFVILVLFGTTSQVRHQEIMQAIQQCHEQNK